MTTIANKPSTVKDSKLEWHRESNIKLGEWKGRAVRVNFIGGRIVQGNLISFDTTLNLILDEAIEYFERGGTSLEGKGLSSRRLGLCMTRGNQVSSLCLADGIEEISNPFIEE